MAYYQFLAFKKSDVTYYGSNNLSSASSVYLPSSNGITIYISDGDVIGNSSIDPGEADVSLSPLVPQPSGSIAVPDTDQLLGQDIPWHAAGEQVYVTAARSVDLPGGDLDDAKIIEFTIGSETFVTAVHTRLSPYTDSDLLDKELKVTDWANSEYPWREQYDQLLGNYYAPDILGGKITCFTLGTLIETNEGNKPIEELQPGDLIATMDDGYQPIRWIGHTTRDAIDLARNPKLKP
ncbi:Hint domain-containing protein, partial [Paracoccus onubensis]|uniref:Hint domain-containing protein n=1 Tax=Paracoccus onubensis TaxID=1675788 RepID=UPI00272F3AC2